MDKEEPSQEKTVCLWWERTGERRNNTTMIVLIVFTRIEGQIVTDDYLSCIIQVNYTRGACAPQPFCCYSHNIVNK